MDNYLARAPFTRYFLTMADLEARQLSRLAAQLADRHLRNTAVRMDFRDNIQNFIVHQLQTIRTARQDRLCQQSLNNLKQERAFLESQDRQLSMGNAKIVATAQLRQENGIWGYVINGVGVVLSGFQIVAGGGILAASIGSGNIIGVAFGGMLALHGLNAFQESISDFFDGKNDRIGDLKQGYIYAVKLPGFDSRTGRLAYSYMDLFLSAYGMSRLIMKPDAWRLFHYLRSDYVRNIKNMSRTDLLIEIASDAMTIKSIHGEHHN